MGAGANSTTRAGSGLKLPERYELRRHIASGGMASVWCAEDLVLRRVVAIKVLAEQFAYDESAVRRFQREARAAARVSAHPHVVTIFDVGDIEPVSDGHGAPPRAFIVMEHLNGGTVAEAIRGGAPERPEAMRWLRAAASALDHAHERGIVHRDVKPANFLLDDGRVLHVADFGIARVVSEDTITSSGELFGTAAYLAPEQALGKDATSASDRYALAVAAFELLTGERPFTAPHFAAQARQHIEDERPHASERQPALPASVDPVLVRGMAKRPEDRYATAGAFVDALEAALDSSATTPTRVLSEPRRAVPVPLVPALVPPPVPATPPRAPAAARARPAPAARAGPARPPRKPSPVSSRRGRMFALAALVVAAAGVVLLGVLTGSGAAPRASAPDAARAVGHHHPRAGAKKRAKAPTSSTASQSASSTTVGSSTSPPASSTPTTPSTPITPTSAPTSAAGLQAQGHQLMLNGSYPAAISALGQAVSAADPLSLTYAYALYDLGRTLVLSGDPAAAIPVLEQRLKIPNQTPVVQQMLDRARRAAGQPTPPASPAPGGAAPETGKGHHHGPNGGGGD
jgi:eukaryotic-like serine/threonine-protein kinase